MFTFIIPFSRSITLYVRDSGTVAPGVSSPPVMAFDNPRKLPTPVIVIV